MRIVVVGTWQTFIAMTDKPPTRRPCGGTVKEILNQSRPQPPRRYQGVTAREPVLPLSDERPGRARVKRVERHRRG
jgi:hypothetical protein